MAEIDKSNKRLVFPHGKQKQFLAKTIKRLGIPNYEVAILLGVSHRTLNDWKREKFFLSQSAALLLSKKTKIRIPKSVEVRDQYWYIHKGAVAGGKASYKKYGQVGGDPKKRLLRWNKWWEEKGKMGNFSPILYQRMSIKKPIHSIKLAEFSGIMMGDGGISARQIAVTLHSENDLQYAHYVRQLMKNLFGVSPSLTFRKDCKALTLVISRTDLIEYCKDIGLKIGHKIRQGLDMPSWVKNNQAYASACIRGLIDTDGSLVIHRYRVSGKRYTYKKINFSSASPPLVRSVGEVMHNIGIPMRLSHDRKQLWIDSKQSVEKYFKVIGSSNPKHLKRYFG